MQVGDRVRVRVHEGYKRAGECATVLEKDAPFSSLLRFDSGEEDWYGDLALEPLPKDLAVGTRVKTPTGRDGEVRDATEGGSKYLVYIPLVKSSFWYFKNQLKVLPPEDSENDKKANHCEELAVDSDPTTLPFEENALDTLDVLIAALDNETLGRVVRALREAGLL